MSGTSLATAIQRSLNTRLGVRGRVRALTRTPTLYGSSRTLERWTVTLDGGSDLELIAKRLGADGLLGNAASTRPALHFEDTREQAAYERVLHGDLPVAQFVGVIDDADTCWLVTVAVDGSPLSEIGNFADWEAAAAAAARFHDEFVGRADEMLARAPQLLNRDRAYYESWFDRAIDFNKAAPARRGTVALLRSLRQRVTNMLARDEVTLVHGELYASNVLVKRQPLRTRDAVAFVDFETIGTGSAALDLAALVTGWDLASRRSMCAAYCAASRRAADLSLTDLMVLVAGARAQLAAQWLGWHESWRPPSVHRRDWAAELQDAAEGLAA